MTILVIAPLMDIPTSISSVAVDELVKWLKEKGVDFKILFGLQANRPTFNWNMLFDKNIRGVFYYGHGSEARLLGTHLFFSLVDLLNNGKLREKIVYTMACLTGVTLGPDSVLKGCRTWYGHRTFYYANFIEPEHNYLADWIETVNEIPKQLVLGKTTGEALRLYKQKISSFIAQYEKANWPNADWYIRSAISNRDFQTLFGDPNARLF